MTSKACLSALGMDGLPDGSGSTKDGVCVFFDARSVLFPNDMVNTISTSVCAIIWRRFMPVIWLLSG